MEREEIFREIEKFGGAVYDHPFEEDAETAVLRHAHTRRWFGVWIRVPKPTSSARPTSPPRCAKTTRPFCPRGT